MRKLLFFILLFAFIFSTANSLTQISSSVDYPFVLSTPRVHFLLSSANAKIYSVNATVFPNLNYVSLYPNVVNGNANFTIVLSEIPCNLYSSTVQVNMTVNSSDGVQTFSKSFVVKSPISLNRTDNLAVQVGGKDTVLINLLNQGNSKISLNFTENVPEQIYVTYYTPNGFFDHISNITLVNSYPIKLNLIGAYVGSGTYTLSFVDPSCSNITGNYTANVRTYTLSSGVFSYKSMDTSILLLFSILSVILIAKLIKFEK